MRFFTPRTLAAFCSFALVAIGLPDLLAQSSVGTIEGRVQNRVTGDYLNNARVAVRGTNLIALTDEGGTYRLNNVPAGTVELPADEALAMVVVEASGKPLVAANADLTGAGGLGTDLAGRFLQALADAAGLTVHVRLIEGEDTDHVLEAIFKALGVALACAATPQRGT